PGLVSGQGATKDELGARRLAAHTRHSATTTQLAPTQPSARGEAFAKVREPRAAPAEKLRNWNDAFSESATGATLTPAMPMSRACWAGKNDHADTPHTAIASRIGARASAGGKNTALVDRLRKASPSSDRLVTITGRCPKRSFKRPPSLRPITAATPH